MGPEVLARGLFSLKGCSTGMAWEAHRGGVCGGTASHVPLEICVECQGARQKQGKTQGTPLARDQPDRLSVRRLRVLGLSLEHSIEATGVCGTRRFVPEDLRILWQDDSCWFVAPLVTDQGSLLLEPDWVVQLKQITQDPSLSGLLWLNPKSTELCAKKSTKCKKKAKQIEEPDGSY